MSNMRVRMSRIVPIVVVIGWVFAVSAFAATPSGGRDAYLRMSRSIAKIAAGEKGGTGFFVHDGQHVATAWHVVRDAHSIVVEDSLGIAYSPDGLWFNETADVALLHLRIASPSVPLKVGSYVRALPGDPVYVLGYPGPALGLTMTAGILSGKRRVEGVGLLQIDAAISPGSSGSPVCNSAGEVIGVISFTFKDAQASNVAIQVGAVLDLLERPMTSLKGESAPLDEGDAHRDDPTMSVQCEVDGLAMMGTELLTAELRWSIASNRRIDMLTTGSAASQVDECERESEAFLAAVGRLGQNACAASVTSELAAVGVAALERASAEVAYAGVVFQSDKQLRDRLMERLMASRQRLVAVIWSSWKAAAGQNMSMLGSAFERVPPASASGRCIAGVLPDPLLQEVSSVAWARSDSGFRDGDRIVEFFGPRSRAWTQVGNWRHLADLVAQAPEGQVRVRVERYRKRIEVVCEVNR